MAGNWPLTFQLCFLVHKAVICIQLFPYYRWGNWRSEILRKFWPKSCVLWLVTKGARCQPWIQISPSSGSFYLHHPASCLFPPSHPSSSVCLLLQWTVPQCLDSWGLGRARWPCKSLGTDSLHCTMDSYVHSNSELELRKQTSINWEGSCCAGSFMDLSLCKKRDLSTYLLPPLIPHQLLEIRSRIPIWEKTALELEDTKKVVEQVGGAWIWTVAYLIPKPAWSTTTFHGWGNQSSGMWSHGSNRVGSHQPHPSLLVSTPGRPHLLGLGFSSVPSDEK